MAQCSSAEDRRASETGFNAGIVKHFKYSNFAGFWNTSKIYNLDSFPL